MHSVLIEHTQIFILEYYIYVFKYSSGYCQSLALGGVLMFGTGDNSLYRDRPRAEVAEVDRIAREREGEAEQVNNTATSSSVCVNPGNLAGIRAVRCGQNTRH